MPPSPSPRAQTLLTTTHTFCTSLISPPSPTTLLDLYFTPTPTIHEHGPSWCTSKLPFLGKPFTSRPACLSYFQLLSSVLEMSLPSDAFPSPEGFIVDERANMVSVVGHGTFTSKATGKSWDEEFIYRFSDFDEEGRIGCWEIWADPLSAWDAVSGGSLSSQKS